METGMPINNLSVKALSSGLGSIPIYGNIKTGKVLKEIDFFRELSIEFLEGIADSVVITEFSSGDIVCRHGRFDDRFYIILSGKVKATIPTADDPKFELYEMGPGDFFGEEILWSKEPRGNTFIAVDDTIAFSLSGDTLTTLVTASEAIRSNLDCNYIERKLVNDLRRIPVFSQLTDASFKDIINKVELISAKKGETIFHGGEEKDAFYLIRSGEISLYRQSDKGKEPIALLGEGQFFGETSLLTEAKQNVPVEVVCDSELVKLPHEVFLKIIKKDDVLLKNIQKELDVRIGTQEDIKTNPDAAIIAKKLLTLNNVIYKHLDIISQCIVDTELGSALLATLPGSRYPYVYPRDSACASRFLYKIAVSPMKTGDIAFQHLGEIAKFILNCQREDGYWGQRYGINCQDKGIYKQEDNIAHGVIILCRYLLAAKHKRVDISFVDKILEAISRAVCFAQNNYYRNEIHLFYSTTSIHESAIEEGYSIWVNFAYLLMFKLIERVGDEYDVADRFSREMAVRKSFEINIDSIFGASGKYFRRIGPEGFSDLRPDVTILSPFYFGTGMDVDHFKNNSIFVNSVNFIEEMLWDPDLGMLQRYLPFIEDPHTHIHAGNGPWIQYTAILAQYCFYTGDIEKGDKIIKMVDNYKSPEGYLCEHLTTPERFYEFKRLEWLTGRDSDKEFASNILVDGITYDLIIEELNHMKKSYDEVEKNCKEIGEHGVISFATPLMWSHAEYAMALLFRNEQELKGLKSK